MNEHQQEMLCRIKCIWFCERARDMNTHPCLIDKIYNVVVTRDNESWDTLKDEITEDLNKSL